MAERAAAKTDEQLRKEILDEQDPMKLVALVHGYYRDKDRADRTSREWLYFDLGLLSGAIMKLVAAAEQTRATEQLQDRVDRLRG